MSPHEPESATPDATARRPRTRLRCPCGVLLTGSDEDDLVRTARGHLAEEHPRMGSDPYTRDEILAFAY